ncbi:hypothetical protein BVRB_013880, partial [Beta vulgaris subsp. vulgaris]
METVFDGGDGGQRSWCAGVSGVASVRCWVRRRPVSGGDARADDGGRLGVG